jgi:hypothetical protein
VRDDPACCRDRRDGLIENREGGAMKKEQEATAAKRRDFLKLAGLGSVTAVAGAALVAVPVEAKEEPSAGGAGYRETAHVKKVYELARF